MKSETIDVFVSRPNWIDSIYEEGLTGFLAFMESHSLKPRTIGKTDYPNSCPLDEVISLLLECKGVIILGYPQISITTGQIKDESISNVILPTEWNHIEASLAYSKRLPLLLIHHQGISRGVFEHGAISKYIYQVDFTKPTWFLAENIIGALSKWKSTIFSGQSDSNESSSISSNIKITKEVQSKRNPSVQVTSEFVAKEKLIKRIDNFIERVEQAMKSTTSISTTPFSDELHSIKIKAAQITDNDEIRSIDNRTEYMTTGMIYGFVEALRMIINDANRIKIILETD